MFPTLLQSLVEVYNFARGLFRRKCSLNECVVLYFSEINRFLEHFEANTYVIMRNVLVFRRVRIVMHSAHLLCHVLLPTCISVALTGLIY